MASLSSQKLNRLQLISNAIDHFRILDIEIPSQIIVLFLQIALHPNATMSELAEKTGLSMPSISKHLFRRWGKKQGGEDFVEIIEDTNDRRVKRVRLNAKGERFLQSLLTIID